MLKNIVVVNDDIADLYVSIYDLNTLRQILVLDGERMQSRERKNLQVQFNSDNKAVVRWIVQKADDTSVSKEEGPVTLSENDSLNVNIFGVGG